jgi:hypothetical protein
LENLVLPLSEQQALRAESRAVGPMGRKLGQVNPSEADSMLTVRLEDSTFKPLRAGINPAPTHETHPKK